MLPWQLIPGKSTQTLRIFFFFPGNKRGEWTSCYNLTFVSKVSNDKPIFYLNIQVRVTDIVMHCVSVFVFSGFIHNLSFYILKQGRLM